MKSKNQKSSSLVKDEDIKLKVNSKKHSSAMKIKLPKKLRNYEMSDPVNSEGDQPQSTNQVISNSDSTSRQNLIIPKRKSQFIGDESDIDEEEVHFKFLEIVKLQESKVQIQSMELEQYFIKRNIFEFNCFLFTLISIFSGIMYHNIKSDKTIQADPSIVDSISYFSLVMISISNLLFSKEEKYQINLNIKKIKRDLVYADNLYTSGRLKFFLFEILLCVFHPNVLLRNLSFTTNEDYYNRAVTYDVNDYLLLLTLTRIYVVFRFFFCFNRFFDVRANRVGKLLGTRVSRVFALRCMMASYPYALIMVSIILFIFTYTFMIRIVEGPVWYLDNDSINFNVIQNCIWCVVVTMTTVGYGDYYPKTNLGRFILMLAVYTGTTLVSFMVVALQNYLKFTDNQIKANLEILKRQYQKKIEKASGLYFLNAVKLNMAQKTYNMALNNDKISEEKLNNFFSTVKDCLYLKIKSKKAFTNVMQNIFDPYDETEILRDKIYNYLGVLHYAIITTKSNEDITNYIKEIVERIKKIMKKHNLKDFKLLKKDLQEKNQKKA